MLAYFDLATPAPRRLAKMRAAAPVSGTWRDARRYSLASFAAAHGCLYRGAADWYCHTGAYFGRRERWADDVAQLRHTGWHTNHYGETFKDGSGLARGFVVGLPHGRFMAGYWWGDNGERVYLPGVYACEREAAYAADSAAERFAESSSADSERFEAMTQAEGHAEAVAADVRNAWEARHVSAHWREHCRDRIAELRAARADLQRATEAYERGEG